MKEKQESFGWFTLNITHINIFKKGTARGNSSGSRRGPVGRCPGGESSAVGPLSSIQEGSQQRHPVCGGLQATERAVGSK